MTDAGDSHKALHVGTYLTEGGDEEYWWVGEPGKRGASVIKTDRFGQRWRLDLETTHWVTQRVAAGLLGVSVMTINNWIREGKIPDSKRRQVRADISVEGGKIKIPKSRKSVSVMPLREIERIGEERGVFLHTELTPEQRRRVRAVSFKWKRGGDKDADES